MEFNSGFKGLKVKVKNILQH